MKRAVRQCVITHFREPRGANFEQNTFVSLTENRWTTETVNSDADEISIWRGDEFIMCINGNANLIYLRDLLSGLCVRVCLTRSSESRRSKPNHSLREWSFVSMKCFRCSMSRSWHPNFGSTSWSVQSWRRWSSHEYVSARAMKDVSTLMISNQPLFSASIRCLLVCVLADSIEWLICSLMGHLTPFTCFDSNAARS